MDCAPNSAHRHSACVQVDNRWIRRLVLKNLLLDFCLYLPQLMLTRLPQSLHVYSWCLKVCQPAGPQSKRNYNQSEWSFTPTLRFWDHNTVHWRNDWEIWPMNKSEEDACCVSCSDSSPRLVLELYITTAVKYSPNLALPWYFHSPNPL